MITKDYIASFKKTSFFNVVAKGILKGDYAEVLMGKGNYRTTSQYEMEDTIPSQVLIAIHILISEGKILSEVINKAFAGLPVSKDSVCLILRYIDSYTVYVKDHASLKLDHLNILKRIKDHESEFKQQPCYGNLLVSIEQNLAGRLE